MSDDGHDEDYEEDVGNDEMRMKEGDSQEIVRNIGDNNAYDAHLLEGPVGSSAMQDPIQNDSLSRYTK